MYAVISMYDCIPEAVDVFPTETSARNFIAGLLTEDEYGKILKEGHFWDNGYGLGTASNAYDGYYWRYRDAEIRLISVTSHSDV